jgi:hypothetical protein
MSRADAIIKRLPKSDRIVGAEVGVYKGALSNMLLSRVPKLHLYMIDRWQSYSKEEIGANGESNMSLRKQETFNKAAELATEIANKYIDRAVIISSDSQKASKIFHEKTLDFVFIDADHSYDAVYQDIYSWLWKIKPGGWMCGHDFHRETVYRAVYEWFPSINVEEDEDNTWFVRIK